VPILVLEKARTIRNGSKIPVAIAECISNVYGSSVVEEPIVVCLACSDRLSSRFPYGCSDLTGFDWIPLHPEDWLEVVLNRG
jgi:hypothetical protein